MPAKTGKTWEAKGGMAFILLMGIFLSGFALGRGTARPQTITKVVYRALPATYVRDSFPEPKEGGCHNQYDPGIHSVIWDCPTTVYRDNLQTVKEKK